MHGAWRVHGPRPPRLFVFPARSKALADWIRLALLLAGDVEPNPGPRQRRSIFAVTDLAVGDVTQVTATRCATELRSFEGYLVQAGNYLRVCHATGELSAYHGNTFVAALRRLLLLQLSGRPVTDVRSTLAPLWRLMRAFHLAVPPEFRATVPATAAVVVAMWAWVMQEIEFAMMVLMAHHCLLRPAEAQNIRVCDVVLLDPEDADWAPGVWEIVALTAPKTRRLPSHTAVQHVLIEDVALADFLEQRLWRRTGADFRNLWHKALNALQCDDLHWQPAGFRGGGATEHFLRHRERRRGRWAQLTTRWIVAYKVCCYLRSAQRKPSDSGTWLTWEPPSFGVSQTRLHPFTPPAAGHGRERGSSFN